MPIYKTALLEKYNQRFLNVAQELFERVCREVPSAQAVRHKGSFSILGRSTDETAAKIVIYDPTLGSATDWPRIRDGVYVWIRANGPIGAHIWEDIMEAEMPWMFRRMWRDETVQVSANRQADFAYFPVLAGDDIEEIVSLIVACSRA